MTPLFRKFIGSNWLLFANIVALAVFGVFAIYSACWMREDPELSNKWRYQTLWLLIGLVGYFGASLIDYRWIRRLGLPFYIVSVIVLAYTTFFGTSVYGTRGWLNIGFMLIQPSQITIGAGIIALALALSTMHLVHPVFRNPFMRLLVSGAIMAVPFLLVLKQGDLGSAIVWIPVYGAMILVGNIPLRYFAVIILTATIFLPFAYFFGLKEYQKKRITTQIEMLQGKRVNVLGEAYNAYNALLAIGSGGWRGKGFKNPDTVNHKGFISPHTAINDFIFPVLAEVHGFRGSLLLLGGFLLLLMQCLHVAFYSRDVLGRLLVVGVVGLLFAHIYQNVGMNLLIMPITGIPLPLISFGGTFTVIVLFLLGLVQSVWIHRIEPEPVEARLQVEHLE